MLIKEITYTDYNGIERTEKFYFNLTQSEIIEMDASLPGGFAGMLSMIQDKKDVSSLMMTFKMFLRKAYGVKSADGRRFEKSEAISDSFEQCPAYDKFFMELVTGDANEALNFINSVFPKSFRDRMEATKAEQSNTDSSQPV